MRESLGCGGTGGSGELDVVVGDGEPEFALSNDTCTDQTLAPSETCSFELSWTSPVGCPEGAVLSALVLVRSEIGDYLGLVARAVCPLLPPP